MALTLDGMLPVAGIGGGSGMGSGVGLGAVGGGVAGLVLGSLLANNGNGGLFGGGNNRGEAGEIAYDALQTQIQTLQGQIGANNIDAGITSVNQNVSGTSRDTLNSIANLSTAQAAANFTTLQSINGLGRDVTAQANQNALQQLNSFNNLTTTTLQGFNNSAMQVQNSTNQIIAQGTANAAAVAHGFCDISRQMAECCCEIKGVVAAEGASTRALINDLNVQSLRDQLASANNKVSNNEQNQYLLSTILAHYTPTPTT